MNLKRAWETTERVGVEFFFGSLVAYNVFCAITERLNDKPHHDSVILALLWLILWRLIDLGRTRGGSRNDNG